MRIVHSLESCWDFLNLSWWLGGQGGKKDEESCQIASATTIVAFSFSPPLLAHPPTLQRL